MAKTPQQLPQKLILSLDDIDLPVTFDRSAQCGDRIGKIEARIGVEPFVSVYWKDPQDGRWYNDNYNDNWLNQKYGDLLDAALAKLPKPTIEQRVEAIEQRLGIVPGLPSKTDPEPSWGSAPPR